MQQSSSSDDLCRKRIGLAMAPVQGAVWQLWKQTMVIVPAQQVGMIIATTINTSLLKKQQTGGDSQLVVIMNLFVNKATINQQ